MKVKIAQSCPTLWDPMDYAVRGVLQARILESVAFPFSRASSQPSGWSQVSRIAGRFFNSSATREARVCVYKCTYLLLSRVWLAATPWTTARQGLLSFTVSYILYIHYIYIYIYVCMQVCVCYLSSCISLFATPKTVARQACLSMEFSRNGLPFPTPICVTISV